jgi:hypothetical protein
MHPSGATEVAQVTVQAVSAVHRLQALSTAMRELASQVPLQVASSSLKLALSTKMAKKKKKKYLTVDEEELFHQKWWSDQHRAEVDENQRV